MSKVRVRLQMERLQLEFRGDDALFQRVVEPLVLGLASGRPLRAPQRAPDDVSAPPAATEGASSVPEEAVGYQPPSQRFGTFTRQLLAKENGAENRIAAFAFFLWNYERKEVFREDEVAGCFRAEGAELPKNPSPLYDALTERRMLAPGGEDGTWRLTSKGRAHVRHHLLSA